MKRCTVFLALLMLLATIGSTALAIMPADSLEEKAEEVATENCDGELVDGWHVDNIAGRDRYQVVFICGESDGYHIRNVKFRYIEIP